MKLLISLTGGLAGAISVTILHELIGKIDHSAPRLDRLGEQATAVVNQTPAHKLITIGLYLTGGLVAAGV